MLQWHHIVIDCALFLACGPANSTAAAGGPTVSTTVSPAAGPATDPATASPATSLSRGQHVGPTAASGPERSHPVPTDPSIDCSDVSTLSTAVVSRHTNSRGGAGSTAQVDFAAACGSYCGCAAGQSTHPDHHQRSAAAHCGHHGTGQPAATTAGNRSGYHHW